MTGEEVEYSSKFRWRLESKSFPDLSKYVVDVQHDYFNKSLTATILDALIRGKPVVHGWILSVLADSSQEEFTLSQFEGNGDLLYEKKLTGIKLIGHKCHHNYECDGDDLMDHQVLFTYESQKTLENKEKYEVQQEG
jgi:hypothetical protein